MSGRLIWRALRARLRDERAELDAVRPFIARTDVVCDVGANKGSYLYWLSRWADRVVAFEPQIELANYLDRSFRNTRNVTIEAKAVFSQSGSHSFYAPSPGSPAGSLIKNDGIVTTVPVVTLDEYFQPEERIAFIKIDVEGAELGVLRGATRILKRSRPVLLIECEARHCSHDIQKVFDVLEYADYTGSFFDRRQVRPLTEFEANVHQSRGDDRYWNRPSYCNNFLFIPRDLSCGL